MKKQSKTLVFSLAVIALILLGVIVKNNIKQSPLKPESSSLPQQAKSNPSNKESSPSAAFIFSDSYKASLTKEEQAVLKISPQPDIIKDNNKVISSAAKDTDSIEIGKCEPKPLVSKTTMQSTITLKNSDSDDHMVGNFGTQDLVIPANSSKNLKIDFKNGKGFYTYTCDKNISGYLIVE